MKYSIWALFVALLLLSGCEQRSFYKKIYDKRLSQEKIDCLQIRSDNPIASYLLKENPFIAKKVRKRCPWRIQITSHFIQSCTSAKARALGSDFDGFIRLDIKKDGKEIYRIQADFKGCLRDSLIQKLITQMRKDLRF